MTSELKPCPFCGANAKVKPEGRGCYAVYCDNLHRGGGHSSKDRAVAAWNTRAVPDVPDMPDVPELVTVTYDEDSTGKNIALVSRTQAAEIIAAKDKEIERLKHLIDGDDCPDPDKIDALFRRAEAAEAELAQCKDQIPIGYITPKAQLSLLQEFSASDSISPVKMGKCRVAIYDKPAPAADLKAENEKLLDLVQNITKFGIGSPEHFRAVNDARAALKVETSNE